MVDYGAFTDQSRRFTLLSLSLSLFLVQPTRFSFLFSHLCNLFSHQQHSQKADLSRHPATPLTARHTNPQQSLATNVTGTDQLLLDIADYVIGYEIKSKDAVKTARYAIMDSLVGEKDARGWGGCLTLGEPRGRRS